MKDSRSPPRPSTLRGIRPISELMADFEQAMSSAGFNKTDPMQPVLVAYSQSIEFLDQRMQLNEERVASTTHEALNFISMAKQTADAEEQRLIALCRKVEADLVTRFSGSVEKNIETFLDRRRVREDVNAGQTVSIIVILVFLVSGYVLYSLGHRNAVADIHETETGLEAAFRRGPEQARQWMQLMQDNDISAALEECGRVFPPEPLASGKLACHVPLWLEKPPVTKVP